MPERDFDGQRFVRFQRRLAEWQPGPLAATECLDTGIGDPPAGSRARASCGRSTVVRRHPYGGEFLFLYVRSGSMRLRLDDGEHQLDVDSVTIPAGRAFLVQPASNDLEWLEVALRRRTIRAARAAVAKPPPERSQFALFTTRRFLPIS